MKKFLRKISVYSALLASLTEAAYGNIFAGLRGPTRFQADFRPGYSKSGDERRVESSDIFKYWDTFKRFRKYKGEIGPWAFTNFPVSYVSSPKGKKKGPGDITGGIGVRGSACGFNALPYYSRRFPTGGKMGKERTDNMLGGGVTYVTSGYGFEANVLGEYNWTGTNKQGINPPNEVSFGFMPGGRVSKKFRVAGGVVGSKSGNKLRINGKAAIRFIPWDPKIGHVEGVVQIPFVEENMPTRGGFGVYSHIRYNF